MKATLEFDFDNADADDKAEHARMLKATDLCRCLSDMDIFLRDKTKYGNSYTTPDDALHAAREKLHELMEQNGIVLDDLYN